MTKLAQICKRAHEKNDFKFDNIGKVAATQDWLATYSQSLDPSIKKHILNIGSRLKEVLPNPYGIKELAASPDMLDLERATAFASQIINAPMILQQKIKNNGIRRGIRVGNRFYIEANTLAKDIGGRTIGTAAYGKIPLFERRWPDKVLEIIRKHDPSMRLDERYAPEILKGLKSLRRGQIASKLALGTFLTGGALMGINHILSKSKDSARTADGDEERDTK